MMQELATCLWFDRQAAEAVKFYTSVFRNSKVINFSYKPDGTIMAIEFELNGHPFIALNGGPVFRFTEAVSLVVKCESQLEVDEYWDLLCADGGKEVECGWLKDKYGLSWQIVPSILSKMLQDKDLMKVNRVMAAMLKMKKLEIAKLKEAYEKVS